MSNARQIHEQQERRRSREWLERAGVGSSAAFRDRVKRERPHTEVRSRPNRIHVASRLSARPALVTLNQRRETSGESVNE
jgi:hypothetical protein